MLCAPGSTERAGLVTEIFLDMRTPHHRLLRYVVFSRALLWPPLGLL
jgi:hypothetical protein